jgi:hypothetical protein
MMANNDPLARCALLLAVTDVHRGHKRAEKFWQSGASTRLCRGEVPARI